MLKTCRACQRCHTPICNARGILMGAQQTQTRGLPQKAPTRSRGPFRDNFSLSPWLRCAEKLVLSGPTKGPIGPEQASISPEKAPFPGSFFVQFPLNFPSMHKHCRRQQTCWSPQAFLVESSSWIVLAVLAVPRINQCYSYSTRWNSQRTDKAS